MNPTQSPFINKLMEISFDSVDFMRNEDRKIFFKKMFKDVPGAELSVPKKESPLKVKSTKKKAQGTKKTPYQSLRTPSSETLSN